MSILEFPRIYFNGEISWDPITTNNNTLPSWNANYDEAGADPQLDGTTVTSAQVSAFRQTAIEQIPGQNWNPAGTHRSVFYNCRVSGVDTGSGLDTADPFVTAPVNFAGMLVDSEPYGPYSSQLFFDAIHLGIDGGCRLLGTPVRRSSDRYINFNANPANNMIAGVASVMWQACYAWDPVTLTIDAFDSPALAALLAAMSEPGVKGVMTRFVTYRTIYYDDIGLSNGSPKTLEDAKALMAKFAAGGFQPNPARGLLVGTAGIWRDGDPMQEPGDRALLTNETAVPLNASANAPSAAFGTAWARVNDGSIAFDLSNSIPWQTRTPDKAVVGNIYLAAGAAPLATLTPDQYNQAAYLATSGIIDVALPATQIALDLSDLTLAVDLAGARTTLLAEQALRAIPLEPNFYVDQGDTAQAQVRVYDRGAPVGAGIQVTMAELGSLENNPPTATTDGDGIATFPLKTSVPAVVGLIFQPGANPVLPITPANFDPQIFTYMYLRVLPADDQFATMEPSWKNVHDNVLSYWEAMAPCMDNWLRLGDEAQVRAYAEVIKKLTDPDYFERFRYMPVTRDLTRGQRTLLYNFLDGTTSAPTLATAPAEHRVPPTDFGKLARAMRGA
ncbi:MAG: hypothetical protein JWR80_6696 [Bradyrhizobium sp.]|nr:hypothetical protein [Bradyrhizobium sp.]